MRTSPSNDMDAFRKYLKKCKNIIAVAGAGLSAASGIPTFRGAGGMWRKYDAMSLATPEAFNKNPSLVWQFYHMRREKALLAQPNAAHRAIAHFSIAERRHKVAPSSNFALITQNVDGLSVRALKGVLDTLPDTGTSGSDSPLFEMHGRIHDVRCTSSSCGATELDFSSPICEGLRGTDALMEAEVADPELPLEKLPRCKRCQALARPGVVWFGERPVHMDEIDELVEEADLCIVIGTSSTVYPAAGYASEVAANGGKVAVFNLERSAGDAEADFLFLGPCERTLPEALGMTPWL